jgi:hypothetical protein
VDCLANIVKSIEVNSKQKRQMRLPHAGMEKLLQVRPVSNNDFKYLANNNNKQKNPHGKDAEETSVKPV